MTPPMTKTWFVTKYFDRYVKLKAGVNEWLKSQTAKCTQKYYGIDKLVRCYDKCFNLNGDYVKKQFKSVRFKCNIFFFLLLGLFKLLLEQSILCCLEIIHEKIMSTKITKKKKTLKTQDNILNIFVSLEIQRLKMLSCCILTNASLKLI